MSLVKSLVVACSILSALAAPSTLSKRFEDHVVHEERSSIPHEWVKDSNMILDKTRTIPVRINLVQNNLDEKAEDLLMSVSHPESPKYGEHYSPHDIADLVRPFEPKLDFGTNFFTPVLLVRAEERCRCHCHRVAQGRWP